MLDAVSTFKLTTGARVVVYGYGRYCFAEKSPIIHSTGRELDVGKMSGRVSYFQPTPSDLWLHTFDLTEKNLNGLKNLKRALNCLHTFVSTMCVSQESTGESKAPLAKQGLSPPHPPGIGLSHEFIFLTWCLASDIYYDTRNSFNVVPPTRTVLRRTVRF